MRDLDNNASILQASEQERAEYLLEMCTGMVLLAKGMGKRGEMVTYLANMMALELEAVLQGAESPVPPPTPEDDRRQKEKAMVALFHYMKDE
ncbi:MAG: hypothetical protein AAFQ10_09515 [Pseudomonadota bacterium]